MTRKYFSIQVTNREFLPEPEALDTLERQEYPYSWQGKLGVKAMCGMLNWFFRFAGKKAAKKSQPLPPLPHFVPMYNEETYDGWIRRAI